MNAKGRPIIIEGKIAAPEKFTWRNFRKRPTVISAVRMDVPFKVETLEGWHQGQPGDWLVEDIGGELYPCRNSIFEATYEPVAEEVM